MSPPRLTATTSGFGMIVFIASDLMLFAAFFAAYLLLRSVNELWPSPVADLNTAQAAAATAMLLGSSVTAVMAERRCAPEMPPGSGFGSGPRSASEACSS